MCVNHQQNLTHSHHHTSTQPTQQTLYLIRQRRPLRVVVAGERLGGGDARLLHHAGPPGGDVHRAVARVAVFWLGDVFWVFGSVGSVARVAVVFCVCFFVVGLVWLVGEGSIQWAARRPSPPSPFKYIPTHTRR